MALFPLLVAVALSGDTLNIDIPAGTVTKVLEEVSRQTGKRFEARGSCAREYVIVHLKDAKLPEFLPHLAQVVGGEWKQSQNALVLVESAALEKQERDAQIAAQRRNVQVALDEREILFRKNSTFDAPTAEAVLQRIGKASEEYRRRGEDRFVNVEAVDGELPLDRLLFRLTKMLPLGEITGLPDGARIVYSDHPTRMQRPFPSAAQDAIRDFVREQGTWRNVTTGSPYSKDGNLAPALPPTFKVNVVVNDWEDMDGLSADIYILNPARKIVCTTGIRLDGADDKKMHDRLTPPRGKESEKRVEEGAEASELRLLVVRDARSRAQTEDQRAAELVKWKPRLTDPVRFEPLSYIPGALWTEMAKAKGKNLVANAYEEAFSQYADPFEGSRTPSTILDRLSLVDEIQEDESWITIWPKHLTYAKGDRVDRPAVGNLLRRSIDAGGLRIDDAADYVANHTKHNGLLAWDGAYLGTFFPGTGPRSILHTIVSREELRFYGLLSDAQRTQLFRQGVVYIGDLSQEARDHLIRMVYWKSWLSDDQDWEPTEALPDGIPNNGTIRIASDETELLVQPYTEGRPLTDRNLSPESADLLGRTLGRPGTSAEAMAWNRFRLLSGRTLRLRIDYAPGFTHIVELYEVIDRKEAPVTWDQLPQDFRDQTAKAKLAAAQRPVPTQTPPPP